MYNVESNVGQFGIQSNIFQQKMTGIHLKDNEVKWVEKNKQTKLMNYQWIEKKTFAQKR